MRESMRPDGDLPHHTGVPHNETDRPEFGKDVDYNHDGSSNDENPGDLYAQAGVKRIEAVSKAWTKTSLIIAYASLLLIANVTSLEIQTTGALLPYATSAFASHSLVSTISVVQGVVAAVIKPPAGKIADVFGRLESFSIIIFLYTIGYIMQAGSNNVQTFAGAQIFWSTGYNGLLVLQQIFVADTTDLLNRALFSTLFDLPFLWTTWAGPEVGASILKNTIWRWGYGIWAIILPICFIPLAASLFMNQRRAKKLGFDVPSPFRGSSTFEVAKNVCFDLDVGGLLLFAAAISLILLPLTLAPSAAGQWTNASMIAMLVIGGVLLLLFPLWETSRKLAPMAFFPPGLFKERTIIAGVLIAFFYFMAFYMSVFPYFNSYLQIVQGQSITTAGYITRVFTFSSTIASVAVSLIIKYTAHYKYYVTCGSAIYLLGMGLMLAYRTQDASVGSLVGTQIVIGIGGGLLNVPVQLGVQASASHQQVAAATTVWLTLLEVGGAVGSAISGAIWSTYIPSKLQQYLPEANAADWSLIYGDLTISSNYTTYPIGSPARIAINQAYQETMRYLLIGALCCAAPILPLTFFLKNYKLDEMDQKVVGNVIGSAEKREKVKSWKFWQRRS
ncbi:mfs general substrate transporter [Stemphylium lycopersici]|uniref:Mfs general substrate transporter n=1 Tax=Stemphylium lycopersici TaxID=183478 RepID=A0A364N5A5_STELY|nr:mfs general substrate transporter [Stemphylium lycopersici]RAR04973.1 mfs general substrate transporter [Stemphylium lycopersici]RAR12216.1 mfs general substrate transporter [Stemphylium lycopersici]